MPSYLAHRLNVLKRLIDVLASGVALTLLAPLLAALGLWVRLDTRGPVLFRQVRLGRGERPFVLVKLRTMVHRGEAAIDQYAERVVAGGSDARITRAGRFLRRTSLDEIPQLWNVLRGDMSLVGPRPVLPEQRRAIPAGYEERFAVRPGITGLAQVSGRRGLDWLDTLRLDREYARKRSLLMDLRIILRTFVVMLSAEGVYAGDAGNWRRYIDRGSREGGSGAAGATEPDD